MFGTCNNMTSPFPLSHHPDRTKGKNIHIKRYEQLFVYMEKVKKGIRSKSFF